MLFKTLIVLFGGLFATEAISQQATTGQSSQFKLIDLEKLDLKYSKLDPNNRDPLAPQYTGRWSNRAQLDFKFSLLGSFYWDNEVHTETIETGQVKTVGWHWEAGLRLNKYFSVFEEHHSRHLMDEADQTSFKGYSGNDFPVENSLGIKIHIIEEKPGKSLIDSLFGK